MHDVRTQFAPNIQPAPHQRASGIVTSRSRLTNAPWRLDGCDMRTPRGRRFRDLCQQYAGSSALSEAERAQVRQAALLTLRCEDLQAAQVRGETVDGDEVIRISSEIRRVLAPIAAKAETVKQADAPQTLKDYLASKAAEKASAA